MILIIVPTSKSVWIRKYYVIYYEYYLIINFVQMTVGAESQGLI